MHLLVMHDISALRLRRGAVPGPAAPDDSMQVRVVAAPAEILHVHGLLGHRIRPERIAMRHMHGLRFVLMSRGGQPLAATWLLQGGTRYIDELCWGFPLASSELWLRDVFVRPDSRGQGLFRTLVHASAKLLAPDWTSVWSDVDTDNVASMKAHHAAGFVDAWRARCYDFQGRVRWRPPSPPWHLPTTHLAADRRLVCMIGLIRATHRGRIA